MNPIIHKHVLPLVGKVTLEGYDDSKFGNVLGLQMKIQKHIKTRNAESLKKYLAFLIQTYPSVDDCPIDKKIIKEAMNVIGEECGV